MATTKRKFNISYGNALEYSKDMRNLFLDDSDDFVAFDADFDEDFTDMAGRNASGGGDFDR